MTNLYLSDAACKFFGEEPFEVSPEVAELHWSVHAFRMGDEDHLIITEERSLYTLVIFTIYWKSVTEFLDLFPFLLGQQLRADGFSEGQMRFLLNEVASSVVYPIPYLGNPTAKTENLIKELQEVFNEASSLSDAEKHARGALNKISREGKPAPADALKMFLSNFVMKHEKAVDLNEILLNITFEVYPQHKSHPAPDFIYQIEIITPNYVSEKKINRTLSKYFYKIAGIWRADVYEYTTHQLKEGEVEVHHVYYRKGEKITKVYQIYIVRTLSDAERKEAIEKKVGKRVEYRYG
jgi:hypothetical protein